MFKCFKKRDRSNSEASQTPITPIYKQGKNLNIGLFIGHNSGTSADTYNPKITEYQFNRRVAEKVEKHFHDKMNNYVLNDMKPDCHRVTIFHRNKNKKYGSAMKEHGETAKENRIDLAIELHCNAAGVPEAKGYEALVAEGDIESAKIAHRIGQFYGTFFSIVPRGSYRKLKGVRSRNSKNRGFYFMYYMFKNGIKSFIWEPFFGDYRTKDTSQFLDNFETGTTLYANWLIEALEEL